MANPLDSQLFESFIPVYDAIPNDWKDARPFMVEQLKKIGDAINAREIGWYLDKEVLSGKAFFPTANMLSNRDSSQQFRQVFRKVIDFGVLPNAGLKSVPHGILITDSFTLVQAYAAATDPVGFNSLQIPYASPAALNLAIALSLDATSVSIRTGVDRTAFTRCFVIIEYLDEV